MVGLDSRLVQPEIVRVWPPPDGSEKARSGNGRWAARHRHGYLDRPSGVFHSSGLSVPMELNSLPFENFLKFRSDFRTLTRKYLRFVVKDGDPAAKTPERLPELEPDRSSTENDQMPGELFQFHQAFVGENVGWIDTRNVGADRASTGVDEYFIGFEQGFAHLYLVRIRKSGLPLLEMYIGIKADLLLHSAAEASNDVVFFARRS